VILSSGFRQRLVRRREDGEEERKFKEKWAQQERGLHLYHFESRSKADSGMSGEREGFSRRQSSLQFSL